jgi:hypothetical protein
MIDGSSDDGVSPETIRSWIEFKMGPVAAARFWEIYETTSYK